MYEYEYECMYFYKETPNQWILAERSPYILIHIFNVLHEPFPGLPLCPKETVPGCASFHPLFHTRFMEALSCTRACWRAVFSCGRGRRVYTSRGARRVLSRGRVSSRQLFLRIRDLENESPLGEALDDGAREVNWQVPC